ncbi:MAG TPA: hypothetical protein VGF67_32875 [Ktedonobacteraceae bacterium]|jgi:hypothetical protein
MMLSSPVLLFPGSPYAGVLIICLPIYEQERRDKLSHEEYGMQKRFRFGIALGTFVVLLALVGIFGSSRLLQAANTLPGSNCTASGNAVVNVTLTRGKIATSLDSISPQICFRFLIENKGAAAYDFLIKEPGTGTVLAASTNIGAGRSTSLDYMFADSPSGTLVNLVYTLSGQQTTLVTYQVYLAR